MEELKFVVAALSMLVALASFVIARRADIRSKKAEAIEQLLGEKEEVGFAALKLLQNDLPRNAEERGLLFSALMQACLFCSSDRARSLLYRVMELNREKYGSELQAALQTVKDTFGSMDRYKFTPDELDLERGKRRVAAVEKVINAPVSAVA